MARGQIITLPSSNSPMIGCLKGNPANLTKGGTEYHNGLAFCPYMKQNYGIG